MSAARGFAKSSQLISEAALGGRSPTVVPRSRLSHIMSSVAMDTRAYSKPKMPLCRSESVKQDRASNSCASVIQNAGRVHLVFRQFKFPGTDVFIGEEFDLLEANDLRSHQHIAVRPSRRSLNGLLVSNLEYPNLCVADRVCEIIHADRLYVCLSLVEV